MSIRETNCTIHWIEIYPLDSAIDLLNNWGQVIIVENPSEFLILPFSTKVDLEDVYAQIQHQTKT